MVQTDGSRGTFIKIRHSTNNVVATSLSPARCVESLRQRTPEGR
jgi:hypothetical protein